MIADKLKQLYQIKAEIKSATEYLYPEENIGDDFSTYADYIRNYEPEDEDYSDYALVLETASPEIKWVGVAYSMLSNPTSWSSANVYQTGYVTTRKIKDIDFSKFPEGKYNQSCVVPQDSNCTSVTQLNYYKATESNQRFISFHELPNCVGIENFESGGTKSLKYAFNNFAGDDLSNLTIDCSGISDLSYIFTVSKISSLPNFINTESVSSLYNAFAYAKMESVDITPLSGMTNVSDVDSLFASCKSLTSIDLTPLSGLTKPTSLSMTFMNCSSLTSIDLTPLSGMNITSINYIFENCTKLESIKFCDWPLKKMSDSFKNCTKLKYITCSAEMRELLMTSTNFTNIENVTWYITDETSL